MPKISTHLWFDTEAKEAANFYVATFPDSKIVSSTILQNTPSGSVDMLTIKVMDHEFTMISAGPYFKINPSVSFAVACESKEEVDALWEKLSKGGTVMMELAEYPFSPWYGWVQDRFGVSWQIMHAGDRPITQKITPTMMFVGDICGKAEEAVHFYATVFHNSKVSDAMYYTAGEEPDKAGTTKYVSFALEGQEFAAMDSARMHGFSFTEAISFLVRCETQAEIDYYWEKLSAVPESEQCGWLKDKYGFSWQITPLVLEEMMLDKDPQKVARVTEAFLKMKKFDLEKLREAFEGK